MKRVLDVVLSLAGLLVLWPLALVAAIAVVATSRGGAFHAAERVGRSGTRFTMWKFRTMRVAGGARITAANDARITGVGRVLRRLHLDEWPQLWNVLRGDMSLVGPRPEDPAMVDLGDSRWQRVLSVRPGITGPTQLEFSAREARELPAEDPETHYLSEILPAKLASDLGYVDDRTVVGDVAVLLRTLAVPFRSAA